MTYNSRSCRYDTDTVKPTMLDGKGWNKSTECRSFLRNRYICSQKTEDFYQKVIVKKLSDLRLIFEGRVEISYGPDSLSVRLVQVKKLSNKVLY